MDCDFDFMTNAYTFLLGIGQLLAEMIVVIDQSFNVIDNAVFLTMFILNF